MKLAQIEEAIKKLYLKADAKAEERILGDALAMIESAPQPGSLGRRLSGLRMVRKSMPLRLAGAAAIIAVAYVGAQYLASSLQSCSDTTALTIELASNDIGSFFRL